MSVLVILLAILILLLVCAGVWWLLGQTTLTPNMKVLFMAITIIVLLIIFVAVGPSVHLP